MIYPIVDKYIIASMIYCFLIWSIVINRKCNALVILFDCRAYWIHVLFDFQCVLKSVCYFFTWDVWLISLAIIAGKAPHLQGIWDSTTSNMSRPFYHFLPQMVLLIKVLAWFCSSLILIYSSKTVQVLGPIPENLLLEKKSHQFHFFQFALYECRILSVHILIYTHKKMWTVGLGVG